jgi:hypothetical protein
VGWGVDRPAISMGNGGCAASEASSCGRCAGVASAAARTVQAASQVAWVGDLKDHWVADLEVRKLLKAGWRHDDLVRVFELCRIALLFGREQRDGMASELPHTTRHTRRSCPMWSAARACPCAFLRARMCRARAGATVGRSPLVHPSAPSPKNAGGAARAPAR